MSDPVKNERPEVYALRRESGCWQISRRDFLKAAGIGAAAMGAGLSSGCASKKTLDDVCGKVSSHNNDITRLLASPDGKYLLSADKLNLIKCWDFDHQSFQGDCNVTYSDSVGVGMIDGNPVFAYSDRYGQIIYCKLPIRESPEREFLPIPDANYFVIDSDENIYIVNGKSKVELFQNKNNKWEKKTIFENSREGLSIKDIRLFDHEKRLFIYLGWGSSKDNAFVVLDLRSGEVKEYREYDGRCDIYAVFPNENKALIIHENEYLLISLETGEEAWSVDFVHPNYPKSKYYFYSAAVTADGNDGILLGGIWGGAWVLQRISMSDGSVQNSYIMKDTNRSVDYAGPVFNGSETICAVSEGKSLFFFSLPDLKLLACPVDVNEAKDNTKGIEITQTDSVTGETYTCTLPCGAAIPDGAICTCNCVTGRGGCSCVGHSNSGGGGGSHYWHPN